MSDLGTVKINRLFLFLIVKIQRNGIRIPPIADDRQNTSFFRLENLCACLRCDCLFISSHLSKHIVFSFLL